jgi:hypothetical protein
MLQQYRPYSENELKENREYLYKKLNLSDLRIYHDKCNHFYQVRKNGKKEKCILENTSCDENCSVCWKLNKTRYKKNVVDDLVYDYSSVFYTKDIDSIINNINDINLEKDFYYWLYEKNK